MTGRDRTVLIVVVVGAVLAAAWLLVVSPERKKADTLGTQISSAQAQLASAEGQLHNAQGAQQQYASDYASIVSLGKAVPPSQEVPSLIYQLEQASSNKRVEFASIVSGSGSSSSSSASSAGSSAAAASAASAGFSQMPFTFVFNGTFFDLEHLLSQLNGFTSRSTAGLQVSGRLLTIQGLKLSPLVTGNSQSSSNAPVALSGTITATAYVLPASQGLTGGASAVSPIPASTTGAASSPTTPAVARVTP